MSVSVGRAPVGKKTLTTATLPERCVGAGRWLIATSRWWRPVTGWMCVIDFGQIIYLTGTPFALDAAELSLHFCFFGLVMGLRGWEKLKKLTPDAGYFPGGYLPPNTPIAEG